MRLHEMFDLKEGGAHLDTKPPAGSVLAFGNRATTDYTAIVVSE